MIPLINLERQFQTMKEEALKAFHRVYDSGIYILGHEGKLFEKEITDYLSIPFAIGVGNGTDALVLALDSLDISEGDEVITTPFTFFATAEAISRVGATPVFVDIDPRTYNLNPALISDALTSRTKSIIPVHLFGQVAEMDKIMEIAKAHNLYVIEDACQAFGASFKGKKAGTFGDISCFSFFPTKNLGTLGDGGMVVTKHKHIADRIKRLRHHGSTKKYFHEEIGYNSRLDEIQSAFLRISLKNIDQFNQNRKDIASTYTQGLSGLDGINTPSISADQEHIYHLYCLELTNRDQVVTALGLSEIACGVYYPQPLHLQSVYVSLGYKQGDFPVSEEKAQRLLAIPMHPFLEKEEQDQVVDVIKSTVSK